LIDQVAISAGTLDDTVKNMSWIVYILKCADESLYTGITTDLERRVKAHETAKGARYTNGRGPFWIVHQERYENRAEATKRELAIKSLSRVKKLALIGANPKTV
jgi:putative endonuclease